MLEWMRADIEALPGPDVPPDGALLVARVGGAPAGSVRAAAVGYERIVLDVVPSRAGAIAQYPFPMVFLGRAV